MLFQMIQMQAVVAIQWVVEIIRVIVHPVEMVNHMMVEWWRERGTCNLRLLVVVFRDMDLLAMVRLDMDMEQRAMVLDMEVMVLVVMVTPVVVKVDLQILMGTPMLRMQIIYAGSPPGASRSPWGAQAPGYGSAAYNPNGGYEATAPWSALSTGGVAGTAAATGGTSSAPTGVAGNGNQGYGGSDGSYANPSSYGAIGGCLGSTPNVNTGGTGAGDQQGEGAGYMGGGYNDANSGYQNTAWRSDPSQGGGYGAGQKNGAPGGQVGYGGYRS